MSINCKCVCGGDLQFQLMKAFINASRYKYHIKIIFLLHKSLYLFLVDYQYM